MRGGGKGRRDRTEGKSEGEKEEGADGFRCRFNLRVTAWMTAS